MERANRGAGGAAAARLPRQAVNYSRLHRLSRRRQEIQVFEAASSDAIRHNAGTIPRKVGFAPGLPDGGAELCGCALAVGEANGLGATTPTPLEIVDPRMGLSPSDPGSVFPGRFGAGLG